MKLIAALGTLLIALSSSAQRNLFVVQEYSDSDCRTKVGAEVLTEPGCNAGVLTTCDGQTYYSEPTCEGNIILSTSKGDCIEYTDPSTGTKRYQSGSCVSGDWYKAVQSDQIGSCPANKSLPGEPITVAFFEGIENCAKFENGGSGLIQNVSDSGVGILGYNFIDETCGEPLAINEFTLGECFVESSTEALMMITRASASHMFWTASVALSMIFAVIIAL